MTYVAPTTTVYTNGVPTSTYQGGKSTPINPPTPSSTVNTQQTVNGQNFVPRNSTTGAADYGAAAPKTPTAVVSAGPATSKINNVVVPALTKATAAIAGQNAKIGATDQNYNMNPGESVSAYNARIAAYNAAKNGTPAPTTTTTDTTKTDDAAATIANNPETGHQFAWDASGNRIEIPVGTAPPAGYNTTQPNTPTAKGTAVSNTFFDSSGTTYNQYADGTYGKVDASGNFVGNISATDFNSAQANSPQAVLESIKSSLASVANGSYPLTQAQQAQINGLNSSYAALIATQQQANANFTGATTVAENLYGMGNSIAGLGQIKGTIDSGVSKIADLQAKQAAAVAEMQTSFDDDNMKKLMDAYTVYNDSFKEIQTHIDAMQAFAEKTKVDAQNEQHQQFQDAMADKNLTLNQKKEAFDEYMSKATLDEKTKVDAVDMWYKQQDIALKQAAANGDTTALGTNLKTTNTGIPYVDGTSLSGKNATAAQAIAAKNGIPYLSKDQADAQANIETTRQNMKNIANTLAGVSPDSPWNLWQAAGNKVSQVTGIGSNGPDLQSFNAYRSAAIQALRSMAGSKGLRINQAEILQSVEQDIPKVGDSAATAAAKIAKVNSMLDSQEKGLYGQTVYDTYNADSAKADLQAYSSASPAHADQVKALITAYPTLTDAQIMQLTQP